MDPNPQPPNPQPVVVNADVAVVDSSRPAAGGWVPTPMQRAMGAGACGTLTMFGGALLTQFPGSKGAMIGGLACLALATGLGTALGMNSAGPRRGV